MSKKRIRLMCLLPMSVCIVVAQARFDAQHKPTVDQCRADERAIWANFGTSADGLARYVHQLTLTEGDYLAYEMVQCDILDKSHSGEPGDRKKYSYRFILQMMLDDNSKRYRDFVEETGFRDKFVEWDNRRVAREKAKLSGH